MRSYPLMRIGVVFVAFLLAAGSVGWAASAVLPGWDCAARAIGQYYGAPLSSAWLKVEAAIGRGALTVSGWAQAHAPQFTGVTWGGEAGTAHDWLSLSLSATSPEKQWTIVAEAAPPAGFLYDGLPTILGALTARAETRGMGSATSTALWLSPGLTAVVPAGDATVLSKISCRLVTDSDHQAPYVAESSVGATIQVGALVLSHTVRFAGWFDTFSSLVLSLHLPDAGVTLSGSMLPAEQGFLFKLQAALEWGDVWVLPDLDGQAGAICAGDICF